MSTPAYSYTGLDRRGDKCRGVVKANTENDAYRQITAAGLTPVKIRLLKERRVGRRRRVHLRDVANFTYQLSVLISARVPIGDGIRSIAEQEAPGKLRSTIEDLAMRIDAGGRIADAMAEHTDVFGELYVNTVRAAEQTGNMVKVLEYLSNMLERMVETRQQVRNAVMYPICVISVLCIAVFVLVGFVVPKFAKMFAMRGAELPLFTRILMGIGESVQHFWWLYLAAMVGAGFAVRAAWKRERSRWYMEKALHKVPAIKDILVGLSVARFAQVFGLCLNSGLGLIDALQMAGKAAARPMLARDTERMVDQVRTGGRLGAVLVGCEYLPAFAKRMLTSGEEAAELTRMCGVIARHYERDSASMTKNLSTVIEPVLIVLIATVVLFIALAIFLPMWDMVKLMG
jgi:type II secretory pathway component PulF